MTTSKRTAPTDAPGPSTWPARLKVAIPLAMAILLSAAFVFFLLRQTGQAPVQVASPGQERAQAAAAVLGERIPYGTPTTKAPYDWPDKVERFGGKYPRWRLQDFPEGWNDEIAQVLQSYFDAMDPDAKDLEKFAQIEKVRKELEDYLAGLGPEAVPTLGAILNAEADFVDRRFLLYGLGKLGPRSEAATMVLRDFFVARHGDAEARSEMLHVVKAMTELKNETSFGVLKDFIDRGTSDASYHRYRDSFIEALGDHPSRDQAVDVFVDAMHNDTLEPVRNKAAQALGKVQSPATLPEVYSAVQKERYWIIKQTLLGTIGKIGSPDSLPFLVDIAHSAKESGVRLSAGGAIRKLGTPAARRALEELGRSEPDPEVRARVQDWVKQDRPKSP